MALIGNPEKLTPRKRRAIAALLTERDIKSAALAAKVGARSLYRWLDDPAFRAALAKEERATIDGITRRLVDGQGEALDTIDLVRRAAAKPSDRLRAAQAWVDYVLKYKNLDIEARVIELEKAVLYGKT
jgi:hypothetical protein